MCWYPGKGQRLASKVSEAERALASGRDSGGLTYAAGPLVGGEMLGERRGSDAVSDDGGEGGADGGGDWGAG